jgi:hypothetical protein
MGVVQRARLLLREGVNPASEDAPMRKQIEQMNRDVWKGHSRILQEVTHVVGGIGVGMLMSSKSTGQSKPLAYSLVLLATALHVYAAMVKPPSSSPAARLKRLTDVATPRRRNRSVGGRLKALARAALQG